MWLHYGLPPPLAPPPNEDEDGYWHESGAARGAAGGAPEPERRRARVPCNPTWPTRQPYVSRLQPYVAHPATLCDPGGDAALRELLQLDEQWLLGDALLVRPVPYP